MNSGLCKSRHIDFIDRQSHLYLFQKLEDAKNRLNFDWPAYRPRCIRDFWSSVFAVVATRRSLLYELKNNRRRSEILFCRASEFLYVDRNAGKRREIFVLLRLPIRMREASLVRNRAPKLKSIHPNVPSF